MKWVKVAIGAVIAISVVGLIVGAVNSIITPKPIIIEFEIINIDDTNTVIYSPTTLRSTLYNIVNNYGTETATGTTSYEFTYNNDVYVVQLYEGIPEVHFSNSTKEYDITINNDNIMLTGVNLNAFSIGTYHIVTDINTNSLSPSIITLIGLVPLIFVAGVVSYLFVKTKTKEE